MTPKEIQIAMAELDLELSGEAKLGYIIRLNIYSISVGTKDITCIRDVENYTEDLNAIAEFRKKYITTTELKDKYLEALLLMNGIHHGIHDLSDLVSYDFWPHKLFSIVETPAIKDCEAILRAFNKWKD